jgi:hypothetical protein
MEEEKYLPELMAEKDSLDPSFVHASRLLAEGRTASRRAGRWGDAAVSGLSPPLSPTLSPRPGSTAR